MSESGACRDQYDSVLDDQPLREAVADCECDNTHYQNRTVCMPCWNAGVRFETAYWPEHLKHGCATVTTSNEGARGMSTTIDTQRYYYECGICDCLHPCGFAGDCRDDGNRFALDELEERYGWDNVHVVAMEDADSYPATSHDNN